MLLLYRIKGYKNRECHVNGTPLFPYSLSSPDDLHPSIPLFSYFLAFYQYH